MAQIASAKATKIECFNGDNERRRKLACVRQTLRTAMNKIFESFEQVVSERIPTDAVSQLDVAVATARECSVRLQRDEDSYLSLLRSAGRSRNGDGVPVGNSSPGEIPGTAEYSSALESRQRAQKVLEATRKTYAVLVNELLVDNAAPVLGERGCLVSNSGRFGESRSGCTDVEF